MSRRFVGRAGARAGVAVVTAVILSAVATMPAIADPASSVSIDVGGTTDTYGQGGRPDTIPDGAASFPNWGRTVAHPIPAENWNTARVGDSHYTIPGLTAGAAYQVRLYFMDWYFTHAGQREFDVAIDGATVLTDFDIIGTANAAGADGQEAFGVEKDFPVTVDASGTVEIDFSRGAANQAQVNAIVLTPANDNGVSIDVGGATDAYGQGGRADTIPAGAASFPNFGRTVAHPIPAALWNTSRVGDSHYEIPGLTAGATYEARLYFMDWYFTHFGQREFDVAIDGTTVLKNFDIIGTANDAGADGQEAFGVEKDFPVTVGASGTVSIDFIRDAANQPQVNAIVLTPVS